MAAATPRATPLLLAIAGVAFAGCGIPSHGHRPPSPAAEPTQQRQQQQADLYVGQGAGGVVGFFVHEGRVLRGFVLPAHLNLPADDARRLGDEQRRLVGGTEAWPMSVTRDDDGACRATTLGGPFRLDITDFDRAALSYRMSPIGTPTEVVYSGTAVNIDAMTAERHASAKRRQRE